MKKVVRKIIGAMHISKTTANGRNPIDLAEADETSIDTFYQRMFDRDIYLHVSEISVAMIGVCLTGVSIFNVDKDE
jgi:hypothetical protein